MILDQLERPLPASWNEQSDKLLLKTGQGSGPKPPVQDIAGLPPGEHKVKIELVDPNHNVFPGQVVTLNFTVPEHAKTNH